MTSFPAPWCVLTMCCTNGHLGELFLITLKFVFLAVLLAMFCFVPDSRLFQVGVRREVSKRLSVVSGGSWGLPTIWGISGCCLTLEGWGDPPGRKISAFKFSSLSGKLGLGGGNGWESRLGVVGLGPGWSRVPWDHPRPAWLCFRAP